VPGSLLLSHPSCLRMRLTCTKCAGFLRLFSFAGFLFPRSWTEIKVCFILTLLGP